MKNGGAYIVIVQANADKLKAISRARNSMNNNVFYTTDPWDVMKQVRTKPVEMVITGQEFYKSKLRGFGEMQKALIEIEREGIKAVDKYHTLPDGGLENAVILSEMIYEENPEILVLRYAGDPPKDRGRIVGEIEKHLVVSPTDPLIGLIDSEFLPSMLRNKDWETLRKAFPLIDFYETLETEHERKYH